VHVGIRFRIKGRTRVWQIILGHQDRRKHDGFMFVLCPQAVQEQCTFSSRTKCNSHTKEPRHVVDVNGNRVKVPAKAVGAIMY